MSRFYNTLSQVKQEAKRVGLGYCECLEMSYENLREYTNETTEIKSCFEPTKREE